MQLSLVYAITNYHKSNQNGMVLDQIQRQKISDYEYTVKVVKYNNRQHRKELYKTGELIRTWKNKYTGKNSQIIDIIENDKLIKKEWLKNEIIFKEFFYEKEKRDAGI